MEHKDISYQWYLNSPSSPPGNTHPPQRRRGNFSQNTPTASARDSQEPAASRKMAMPCTVWQGCGWTCTIWWLPQLGTAKHWETSLGSSRDTTHEETLLIWQTAAGCPKMISACRLGCKLQAKAFGKLSSPCFLLLLHSPFWTTLFHLNDDRSHILSCFYKAILANSNIYEDLVCMKATAFSLSI